MSSSKPVTLRTVDLVGEYVVREGVIRAVDHVSLDIYDGECLGLIGESGSGKTSLIQAITRVTPFNMRVRGKVLFRGVDLLSLSDKEIHRIRGKHIAQVFQAAQNSLNPYMKIVDHFIETYRSHYPGTPTSAIIDKSKAILEQLGLDSTILKAYPHQLSGGMKQRVVIALSMLLDPELVFLDEPVSALDLLTQKAVLHYLKGIRLGKKITMVYVTHDIESLVELTDRVAVLYAGSIVEVAPTPEFFNKPLHPYSSGLINSLLTVDKNPDQVKSIPGSPPSLLLHLKPKGCLFSDRCPYVEEKCRLKRPPMIVVESGRSVSCYLYE